MNLKSKLSLGLSLIAMPLAFPAMTPAGAYLESYHPINADPVPTSVVIPNVSSEFAGAELTLKFAVNPAGKPTHIVSVTPGADPRLVASVAEAVSWWKFTPGYRDGRPVARNVELPVVVVVQPPAP